MVGHLQSLRREVAARALPALPASVRKKVAAPYDWSYADLRPLARLPREEKSLLIAPANYGVQAYYWARAAETLPGVRATNLQFVPSGRSIESPTDFAVEEKVGRFSHLWARRQFREIKRNATHILIEAERPILGGLFGGDLREEIAAFERAGITVGLATHGTDVRIPSRHRALEPRSPFQHSLGGLTAAAEARSLENHELMDALSLPEFVPTPDLLAFRPLAKWLPLTTDPGRWEHIPLTSLDRGRLVVTHFPSRQPALKGSAAISEAMRKLHQEGAIEYREVDFSKYETMPQILAQTDIVVNQVDMGLYATVAVEAMFAGRLVVAGVGDRVRRHIRSATGLTLPIVEADGSNVYDVVKEIVARPGAYSHLPPQGREFARAVHSPQSVGEVLRDFLDS